MDQDLLALEQSPTSDNLLRRVFRTMHTIKGVPAFWDSVPWKGWHTLQRPC